MLALLALLMALLFLGGLLPPAKKYLPGHEWFMASLSVGLVLFCFICALIGFRKRGNPTLTMNRPACPAGCSACALRRVRTGQSTPLVALVKPQSENCGLKANFSCESTDVRPSALVQRQAS
jgi:hypothetical protein